MQRALRILGLSCCDVCEAFARVVNQQQMDAFALKLVVVVQPLGVDDGHIALDEGFVRGVGIRPGEKLLRFGNRGIDPFSR